MSSATQVTFYVTRNPLGDFSCGQDWVEDIADARLYRKIGPAKAAATRWVKDNPEEPACEVLEWKLDIATAAVLDMSDHTKRSLARIERQKQERTAHDLKWRWQELQRKEQELAAERKRLTPIGPLGWLGQQIPHS